MLLASCDSKQQSASDEMASLYPAPQTIAVNTEEGYIINPVTGDSIQPLVNSIGDTIKTGVPVPAIGKAIHPDSVAQPEIISAGEPKVVSANLNVHEIPEALTVIPVNKNSLKTFTPGVDTSSFVLVNSTGDTIPTGVPIPAEGKVMPFIQPKPIKALRPRMKDNASINMKYLDVDQGMNSSYVMSILEDNHGNLWFGTWGGGVSMYNGESFTHFTEKEGLSNNTVWSILEESNSKIWLSTEKGLNQIVFGPDSGSNTRNNLSISGVKEESVNVAYKNPAIHTYSLQDGLKSMYFYLNSALLDSKNRIWWGSGTGLTMLNMKNFNTPVDPPSMQLNRIDINEQFVDYRHLKDSARMNMEFNGVSKFYNYPLNLELPYNNNHLTFHFSAIDWSAPHKIRYSYKMEGLNDKWSIRMHTGKLEISPIPVNPVRKNGICGITYCRN